MNVNGGHWIRTEKRQRIYRRDRYRCIWCDYDMTKRPKARTLDHVLPRASGGSNRTDNLITSCIGCNSRRQHRSAIGFAYDRSDDCPDRAAVILERIFSAVETDLPEVVCL